MSEKAQATLGELVESLEDSSVHWIEHPCGVEFGIRAVPAPELRRISKKFGGRERKLVSTKEGQVNTINVDQTFAFATERACLALYGSRKNATFSVAGAGLAANLSLVLGRPVKAGEIVNLDGEWTMPLKELVLTLKTPLRDWINEQAGKLEGEAAEGEEGKDKG